MTSCYLSTRQLVSDLPNFELNLTESLVNTRLFVVNRIRTVRKPVVRQEKNDTNLICMRLFRILLFVFSSNECPPPPFVRAKCRYVISTWRDLWNNNDDVIMGTKIWKKYCVLFCSIFIKRQCNFFGNFTKKRKI